MRMRGTMRIHIYEYVELYYGTKYGCIYVICCQYD